MMKIRLILSLSIELDREVDEMLAIPKKRNNRKKNQIPEDGLVGLLVGAYSGQARQWMF